LVNSFFRFPRQHSCRWEIGALALLAKLTDIQSRSERRKALRRTLRLVAPMTYAEDADGVVILDLSSTGMMIETAIPLQVGDTIDVELPRTEPQDALVVWQRKTYFGCKFVRPVPQVVVNAALLLSPAANVPQRRTESVVPSVVAHAERERQPTVERQPTSPLLTSLIAILLAGVIAVLLLGLMLG
jgi:hypothetical protein